MMSIELGTYKHYKGNLYEVIALATHSESLEKMVVYKALYQKKVKTCGLGLWLYFRKTFLLTGKRRLVFYDCNFLHFRTSHSKQWERTAGLRGTKIAEQGVHVAVKKLKNHKLIS